MTTYDDHEDPRHEAILYGLDSLDDRALVGVLLGKASGGRPSEAVAGELLDKAGGVVGMARCGPHVFAAHPGVGIARALRLAAAIEVGRRLARRAPVSTESFDDPAQVAELLGPRIGSLIHEEMWVLSLDGANRLRGLRRVAQGGLHSMSVVPGDVLRAALWDGAVAFILAHNHPSGRLEASPEDVETTVRLAACGQQLGIPMLDHVIVTAGGNYLSMAELGVLGPRLEPRRRRRKASTG